MTRVDRDLIDRIKSKWMAHAPEGWWGDRLDSRFLAASLIAKLRHRTVLDVGCNAGILLSELDDSNRKIGVELSADALRTAQQLNPAASLIRADMLQLPFQDESMDAVIFCGMLEVQPPERKRETIQELGRVLKHGGELYLTTPNRRYPRYRRGASFVTYEELCALLEPTFVSKIKGFNPLPPFPYGLPNAWLARVPGIWQFLSVLMAYGVAARSGCAFLVTAVKCAPAGLSAPRLGATIGALSGDSRG